MPYLPTTQKRNICFIKQSLSLKPGNHFFNDTNFGGHYILVGWIDAIKRYLQYFELL